MIEVHAGFRINASASDVWALVNWSGIEALSGKVFFNAVTFSSREPVLGATRTMTPTAGGSPFTEVLLSYDEGARRYRYGVLDGGDLPLGDYTGQLCVTPAGNRASTLCFSSRLVPIGMTAAEFQTFYSAAEQSIADAVTEILGCAA
ncbi:MAG: SRPBCC family protein [Sphingomonadales bacterium]|nr:SRPBCC family protein [Sphingomonadales bacterium]